jgi:hypothetical protein
MMNDDFGKELPRERGRDPPDLIEECEYALEALDYYDDIRRVRGDLDNHTDAVIVLCGRALHAVVRHLRIKELE